MGNMKSGKKKITLFKIVSLLTSLLFFYLFIILLFKSDSFCRDIGLQPDEASSVLAKRASVLMLGISVLLFCVRDLAHSMVRRNICFSAGIILIGLACTGSFELIKGTVNNSILQAIVIETILGFAFFAILFFSKKTG
jgi:hypothetical protein